MTAQILQMPTFTPVNHFRRYWALGYRRLVPILPPDAEISPTSSLFKRAGTHQDPRGKAPGIRLPGGKWVSYDWLATEADERDLDRWHEMGAGVGIRGGAGLYAIDADTLDLRLARVIRDEVERRFGRLPIRVGNYPKALYLVRVKEADARYRRVDFGNERVEVLGEGKQFVAQGIHPVTRNPYSWPRPIVPFDQLPTFEERAFAELLDALAKTLPQGRAPVVSGGAVSVSQGDLRGELEVVRKAVASTPNTSAHFPQREDYVGYGYAIKAALPDDEPEAFAIFSDWCDRWTDGVNNPDVVASDWRRIRPPFRRGAPWLFAKAAELSAGAFTLADVYYDGSFVEPAKAREPRDVFGDGDTAAVLDLPRGALPSVVEDWALDTSERMGAPSAFAAVAALATVSGALGSKLRIQPKQHDTSWTEPAFLWFAIVEEPGGKKSPIISAATAPLSAADARHARAAAKAYAEWEERKVELKRQHLPSGPEPKAKRMVMENFTLEALSSVLADNPAGVLVRQDELTQLIGSLDQYKGGRGSDRPMMLSLFDGRESRVDRAGKRHLHVECWGASILGGIQPRKITEMAHNLDADGFLQRFLVVWGDGAKRRGIDRAPDAGAALAYRRTVEHLAEADLPFAGPVVLSTEAHVVWSGLLTRIETLADLPGLSDAWRGHLGKWPGFSARLLLIHHVLDVLDVGLALADQQPVSVNTARRAARVVEWLLGNSLRFYAECIGAGEAGDDAKWIAGYILARGIVGQITRRDVGQARRELRDDPDRLGRAMRFLEHMDWLTPDIDYRVDRHGPARWTICPLVHERFAPRAEQERRRRGAEVVKIEAAAAERRRLLEPGGPP